jgi:hypothetical protein
VLAAGELKLGIIGVVILVIGGAGQLVRLLRR